MGDIDLYDNEIERLSAKFAEKMLIRLNIVFPAWGRRDKKAMEGNMKSEHLRELCQACKAGICNEVSNDVDPAVQGFSTPETFKIAFDAETKKEDTFFIVIFTGADDKNERSWNRDCQAAKDSIGEIEKQCKDKREVLKAFVKK